MKRLCLIAAVLAVGVTSLPVAAEVDAAAANALVRKSKCLTCHAIDKKKDGPAYKEVAAKHKGKADAEEKLIKHVTVPSKVKVDGKEEDHETLKTDDPVAVKNVVQWILSL
ncbi:MAG: class I cytochrome c [Aromatoleum sp.]|jgi:cytochrome c|uniref:c-type cytochrome n=1 Tax=Aromatoleum sp. TaxID=2307007 RepID=UPI002894F9D0|nr:c-type cytochrome [Aromatoleum sp.]MDT3669094.1 class I cytochrome c [Aromatoleum sp.]